MKILLLNHTDSGGGAATAALRLVTALNAAGHDADLGVLYKKTGSKHVIIFPHKNSFADKCIRKIISKFEVFLFHHFHTTNSILHSLNLYSRISIEDINNSDYDIVHLHWINSNMISIKDIGKITKPIVWTLHDSWPFCGAEHHPNILELDMRFTSGYTRHNKPASTRGFDLCKTTYDRKKKYISDMDIHFIAPSAWEYSMLKKSRLFGNSPCSIIPNSIDRNIFKPISAKQDIKNAFNIPNNKKVIGFGAAYDISASVSIKGGYYLIQALKNIPDPQLYQLVIFGPANEDFLKDIEIPVFYSGYIDNPAVLSAVYNCCDVFVCPSIIENLPYTCLESISCGVPVAAFETGGIPDVIEHKYNGYLARPFDAKDLYAGIEYILDHLEEMSGNALTKAQKDFSENDIIQKHINMYTRVFSSTDQTQDNAEHTS